MLSVFTFMAIFFICVLALELFYLQRQTRELRNSFHEWKEITHWTDHHSMECCDEAALDDLLNSYKEYPLYDKKVGFKETSLLQLFRTPCVHCGAKLRWKRSRNKMLPSWEASCSKCKHINIAVADLPVIIGACAQIDMSETARLIIKLRKQ